MAAGKLRALDPLLEDSCKDLLHEQSDFVEHLYQLVTQSIEPPFAISIDGLWGSGKTTVMRLLQSKLRERDGGYPVFWFNPWEYQDAENVVMAFLQYLANDASSKFGKTVYKSLKILGTVSLLGIDIALKAIPQKFLSFLYNDISFSLQDIKEKGEMIEEKYDKKYAKYKDFVKIIKADFVQLIKNISKNDPKKPVIIFFDDLDRCLPDKTIQLLEAVKNLFVIKGANVIFICGIDTHIAKQFIISHYKEITENFAINYFRKIFNLTISMPYYGSEKLYSVLENHLKELYPQNNQMATNLATVIAKKGIEAKIISIRHYLNIMHNFYTFQKFNPKYKFTGENDLIIYLLILKEVCQPLYEQTIQESFSHSNETLGTLLPRIITGGLFSELQSFLQTYFINQDALFFKINLRKEFSNYSTLP